VVETTAYSLKTHSNGLIDLGYEYQALMLKHLPLFLQFGKTNIPYGAINALLFTLELARLMRAISDTLSG